jgi:hypothetical protein
MYVKVPLSNCIVVTPDTGPAVVMDLAVFTYRNCVRFAIVEKRPVNGTNAMALWSPFPNTFTKSSAHVHDAIEVLSKGVVAAPTPPPHSEHRILTKPNRVLA